MSHVTKTRQKQVPSSPVLKFTPLEIPEVILVEPAIFGDNRGFFLETYNIEKYLAGGISEKFIQDNMSLSIKGTIRGLHIQTTKPQGKLVRVVSGEVLDVAVDVRLNSPSFGSWVGAILSSENHHQLYVPPGFAHGFAVRSNEAIVEYKVSAPYDPSSDISIAWNDPDLKIEWGCKRPIISSKDAAALSFTAARPHLEKMAEHLCWVG
jgi:dTDP-4-dehydrorhamnose 3,5-epimerase